MKLRLFIPLMICALSLAGCYRQTEEPFQQVDSAAVGSASTPTSLASVVEEPGGAAPDQSSGTGGGAEDATREPYITPETVPGQVDQPTPDFPTPVPVLAITEAPLSITRFVLPSPTLNFEEALDPNDACVYSVLPGDTLFRLSLAWGSTVEEIMDLNLMDSDALSIGQLVLIPDCEQSEPEPTATDAPATDAPAAGSVVTALATDAAAAEVAIVDTPTLGPRIHVVSAGETLESISLFYRADVNAIIALNNLSNPDRLNVGQELLIPD